MDWIYLAQNTVRRWALMVMVANTPLGCKKDGEFLDQLSDYYFLKKDAVSLG
jgi:hypothetical protein